MRQVVIDLEDDVYLALELCAAKDNLRVKEGIENLLDEAIHRLKGGMPRVQKVNFRA